MSGQLNSDLTGLMSLTFISTHLLRFTLAVIEQYCLFTLKYVKSWDQKLSSGLLPKFMFTHLFLFRFTAIEKIVLFTLTFPRTREDTSLRVSCSRLVLGHASHHLVPTIDIFASCSTSSLWAT